MGWSLSDLGIAGVTVLGVVPSLIIVGVLFLVCYIAMVLLGLVSAVIYTLAGVGLLWFISLTGVFKNMWSRPYVLLLFLILPVAFIWGWCTDHVHFLAMLAPAQFISNNPTIKVQQMSLQGQTVAFITTPQAIAGTLFAIAILALLAVAVYKKKKRRR